MLDKRRIRAAFNRAAPGFEAADFLHQDIRDRLLERLQFVKIDPKRVLDLGAGAGAGAKRLAEIYPDCEALAIDTSIGMLATGSVARRDFSICADAGRLPLPDASVDCIFSNLMLHHCPDQVATLREARRVLRSPGLLAFSAFGPDTLKELRSAWAAADKRGHVSLFMDMHDLGDALVNSGFSEPVLDVATLTVTYENLRGLVKDLRGVGSTNATIGASPGLTGKQKWQQMAAAYEKYRNAEGRLPATVEVIFGIAWCGGRRGTEIEIPIERLQPPRA